MPYSAALRDHASSPRNTGELIDASAVAECANPVCGDRLRLSLRVKDDVIETALFLGYGCAPTIACGSALTGIITGISLANARVIGREDLIDVLGELPNQKKHAVALAIETLQEALKQV